MTDAKDTQSSTAPFTPERALAEIADELARMPEKGLAPYNMDASYAASVIFATEPRIAPHLAALEKLPEFDIKPVQRLPLLALALMHANSLVLAHSPATSTFDRDAVAGRALREYLLLLADVLVNRGAIKKQTVDDIRDGQGNRDLINDLGALRLVLVPYQGSLISKEQLDEAARLTEALTRSLAQHNGDDPALAPLLLQRRKIGSLIAEAHRELSAGLAFLRRRHGDASEIAPTIYVPASRPKKADEGDAEPQPEPADKGSKPGEPSAPSKPKAPTDPSEPSDNPFSDE